MWVQCVSFLWFQDLLRTADAERNPTPTRKDFNLAYKSDRQRRNLS